MSDNPLVIEAFGLYKKIIDTVNGNAIDKDKTYFIQLYCARLEVIYRDSSLDNTDKDVLMCGLHSVRDKIPRTHTDENGNVLFIGNSKHIKYIADTLIPVLESVMKPATHTKTKRSLSRKNSLKRTANARTAAPVMTRKRTGNAKPPVLPPNPAPGSRPVVPGSKPAAPAPRPNATNPASGSNPPVPPPRPAAPASGSKPAVPPPRPAAPASGSKPAVPPPRPNAANLAPSPRPTNQVTGSISGDPQKAIANAIKRRFKQPPTVAPKPLGKV